MTVPYFTEILDIIFQHKAKICQYSQTCKRSPVGQRKSGRIKTCDLLKEVQLICNFL
jgi:hypothetical protein